MRKVTKSEYEHAINTIAQADAASVIESIDGLMTESFNEGSEVSEDVIAEFVRNEDDDKYAFGDGTQNALVNKVTAKVKRLVCKHYGIKLTSK